MDSNIHGLPPNKRYRLSHPNPNPESNLPAKKRRLSGDPPTILHEPNPSAAAATTCSLPAKKRVWALPPDFDLNAVYTDDEKPSLFADETNDSDAKPSPVTDETNDGVDDDDDGIVCAICQSTDGDAADPIVLCDGCDLMVHVSCYGSPLIHEIPDGDWFCAQCVSSSSSKNDASFSCCLCPNLGGAMKPVAAAAATEDEESGGKWAHVVCAVFVPEVFFKDAEGREGIECSRVPRKRYEDKCYVCKRESGCVVNCSEPKCGLSFHVTCGLKEELSFEYRQSRTKSDIVAGFCKTHSDLWKKQEATGKYKIVAREE